jgi:hypothetical protein
MRPRPRRGLSGSCVSAGGRTATGVIAMTLAEYESVRADPRQFAVARDHVLADLEQVVAGTDRYALVAKREGTPAAVAVEEDPRG